MNLEKESMEKDMGLLKETVLRSYVIPEGISFGITHTARCRNSNRNDEILQAVEKTNPKVMMEFEFALKGVMITIECNECGIDKTQTSRLLMENHSITSSFEQTKKMSNSVGTGSLFSEHLMTGVQGEEKNGREIKVGGNNNQANYSPSWPSSLDIGSSERSLYKNFKTDRSSDEDNVPENTRAQKLIEIKDTSMNLGNNKTSEKTGMGDSKHASGIQVSEIPEKTDKRKNRFKRKSEIETMDETPIEETQLSMPSTVPYGGSSINDALLEAIGELESGQVVPAITDDMDIEEEEIIVESTLSDHDRIRRLEDMVMTLKKAMIKGKEETDDEIERLRQEVKEGKIGCNNCKRDKKGKGKEIRQEAKSVPYIPKQVLKRDTVPTLPTPILNPFWNKQPSLRDNKETFATKMKNAKPDGFTEVIKRGVKVKDMKL